MLSWEHALRFLWNLALEQRRLALARPRDERRFYTAFDQMLELKELRAELPWLTDVPYNVCAQLLVELDMAWELCFKKLAKAPRYKRKGDKGLGFCEPRARVWCLGPTTLRFPKVGSLHAVVHRPVEGKPRTCTIRHEGDQWFASMVYAIEINPIPRTEPVVAIDLGVVNFVSDSDGRITPSPQFYAQAVQRLARAQRAFSRKKKGSKNRVKAQMKVTRLHCKVRRQRKHLVQNISAAYAKSHGTVVVEKLKIQNMVRSARGTVEAPGTRVRAKTGLNRSILDVGWSSLIFCLRYKLAWSGGQLHEVPAQYSSQTCHQCDHVDAASRLTQADFCCTSCGMRMHADLNAALVLKNRANRSVQPVEGSTIVARRSRKWRDPSGSAKSPVGGADYIEY